MEYLTCGTVGYIVSFQKLKNLKFKFYLVMVMATIVLTIMMMIFFGMVELRQALYFLAGPLLELLIVADLQHIILV